MRVDRLWIKDFRNIENIDITLHPNLNIFTGQNGSGKTNTIEALRMSLALKSHRENKNKNFIRHGKTRADVKSMIVFDDETVATSHLTILPDKRNVNFDGQGNMKKNQLRLSCPVVFFAPEDLDLIKGGASLRREFIDDAISFLSPRYRSSLKEYYEVLRQKSFMLRSGREKNRMVLELYNERLSILGTDIVRHRIRFLQEFDGYLFSLHRSVNPSGELGMNYISNIFDTASGSVSGEIFLEKLTAGLEKEIASGQCLMGIHKDDIAVILNGQNSRTFASQGQQRTISICMKLAMTFFYREKTGQNAIVMLDDVMSELDSTRRRLLLDAVSGSQCFITATEDNFSSDISNKKVFTISGGNIIHE